MISGKNFSSLLSLTLLVFIAGPLPGEESFSLGKILLPTEQPQTMRFQEQKQLGILEQALTDSGILHFIPPDTLIRKMDGPSETTYRIDGNQLNISKGGQIIRQLDLQSNPQLAGFAITLRALLKADIPTLERQYELKLTGSEVSWKLQLTPRDDLVTRIIERISISGQNRQIRFIDIYERGGDHSHMALLPNE